LNPADSRPRLRIAGLAAALLVVCALGSDAWAQGPSPLPLSVEGLDGREVVLGPGAPALHLVFFATWCPPCLDELRDLADVESRWVDRGYRLVLIAVPSRQTRERLAAFVKESSPPGQVLFDRSGSATRAVGAERLPLHLVLDASGSVVLRAGSLGEGVGPALERIFSVPGRGRPK